MRKIILSHLSLSRQVKISNLFTRAEQILFKGMVLPDCNYNIITNNADPAASYVIRNFITDSLSINNINLEDNNIRLGVTCNNCKPCAITLASIAYLDIVDNHIDFSKVKDLLRYQFRVIYVRDHYTMETIIKSSNGYNMDLVRYNNEIAELYEAGRAVICDLHNSTSKTEIKLLDIHLATSENLIMDIHKGVIRIRAKANKFFDLMSSPKVSSINSKCFVFEKQLTS